MARCTYCNYKRKAKEVLALGFSNNGKNCPNCGERQCISIETQNWFTLGFLNLIFVPFLIFSIKLSDKDERLFE